MFLKSTRTEVQSSKQIEEEEALSPHCVQRDYLLCLEWSVFHGVCNI